MNKTEFIQIRVTPEFKQKVGKLANKRSMSLSAFLVMLLGNQIEESEKFDTKGISTEIKGKE